MYSQRKSEKSWNLKHETTDYNQCAKSIKPESKDQILQDSFDLIDISLLFYLIPFP